MGNYLLLDAQLREALQRVTKCCAWRLVNAYIWRYLEDEVSKTGGKILDPQPVLVPRIMSQSWGPRCSLFSHERVGFHVFWDSSRFALSLETCTWQLLFIWGCLRLPQHWAPPTPKPYGLPSVYPVKLLAAGWACLISRQIHFSANIVKALRVSLQGFHGVLNMF